MALYYVEYFIIISLIIINIIFFLKRKHFESPHSLIYYFIIGCCIHEIFIKISAIIFKNNTILINIFGCFEYIILLAFYYKFIGSKKNKAVFIALFFLFLLFVAIEAYFKPYFVFFNNSFVFANIVLIILAVVSFRNIIRNVPETIITDYSYFWLNSAILIYYTCTLFIFGLMRYSVKFSNFNLVLNYTLIFFIFIYYLFLSVGLWKASKK